MGKKQATRVKVIVWFGLCPSAEVVGAVVCKDSSQKNKRLVSETQQPEQPDKKYGLGESGEKLELLDSRHSLTSVLRETRSPVVKMTVESPAISFTKMMITWVETEHRKSWERLQDSTDQRVQHVPLTQATAFGRTSNLLRLALHFMSRLSFHKFKA